MTNDSRDSDRTTDTTSTERAGGARPIQVGQHRLEGMSTDLFVQVPTTLIDPTRALIASEGVGAVYSVPWQSRTHRSAVARTAADQTRKKCPEAAVLLDANLYSGRQRKVATAEPTRDWITVQRSAGLTWALTDSGYVAKGDTAGLRTTLKTAARFGGQVIAALPIASWWLSHAADSLRSEINAHGIPVALMVEDTDDPFDRTNVVTGLVHVLTADVPVLLLRSDTAGLGALAYGAAGAAMGSSTTYRHIYPDIGGGGTSGSVSFILPELLAYTSLTAFERHYLKDKSHAAWCCDCALCGGRDLTWIRTADIPKAAAFSHSVSAVAMLGRGLATAIAAHNGPQAWTAMCEAAHESNIEIEKLTGGDWKRKRALSAWIGATPEPAAA